METKYFKQDEFNKLDWSKLKKGNYATNGENYSIAFGGRNNPNGEGWKIIVYISAELCEEYELPTILSNIIEWSDKEGQAKKLKEIQKVLGIRQY